MTTLQQHLTTFAEEMPRWLTAHRPTARGPMRSTRDILSDFMRSRLVYYPGSGDDGHPVAVFNRAHAAHCYIYVDYLTERTTLLDHLRDRGFLGYRSVDRIDISESDFGLGRWKPHAPPQRYPLTPVKPYAFLEIMERESGRSDEHSAERFAILFLVADGHAAFDALFCQDNEVPSPFCAVIRDHGFGGNYSRFGRDGLMNEIAKICDSFPRFALVDDGSEAWDGYSKCVDPNGLVVEGESLDDRVDGAKSPGRPLHLWERVLRRP